MAFKFPFTNYHELNLTWVLEQLKKLFEDSEENVETIEGYEDRLSAVEDELPVVEATADQAAQTANAAATLAQTAKNTADTANENALAASAQAGLARQEAAEAEAEAQAATQAAQQAQATVQNFDGRITQAEADASEALQEAQSFENRVNAAINTANNAANTATIAQGIAVNANQNAATALDTAQTADGKAEAAQDAADIADGKAEAAQDAADIADGKAEAAQDTADQNAAKIGNLSDLTTTAKNNLVAAINEAAQTGGGTDDTKAPLIVANASGAIASFSDGADDMRIQELICTIEPIQAGTGDPSPTNVRPISGHTGMNLARTGKNLFGGEAFADTIISKVDGATKDTTNKTVTYAASKVYNVVLFNDFKPNTQYTIFVKQSAGSDARNLKIVYDNGVYVTLSADVTVTTSAAGVKELAGMWATGTSIIPYEDFGIFEGVLTADDFEPYTGTTIPITFPETIYGGSDEVIGGALESTLKPLVFDGSAWNFTNGFFFKQVLPVGENESDYYTTENGITVYINSVSGQGRIYLNRNPFLTEESDVGSIINGYKLLYRLAEPNEYTLTPHKLTTLYGVNNIFTDVGAIQSCKYPADTKLYIDGKVAELQALILEN